MEECALRYPLKLLVKHKEWSVFIWSLLCKLALSCVLLLHLMLQLEPEKTMALPRFCYFRVRKLLLRFPEYQLAMHSPKVYICTDELSCSCSFNFIQKHIFLWFSGDYLGKNRWEKFQVKRKDTSHIRPCIMKNSCYLSRLLLLVGRLHVLEKKHTLSETRVTERTFSSSVSAKSKALSVTKENARNLFHHSWYTQATNTGLSSQCSTKKKINCVKLRRSQTYGLWHTGFFSSLFRKARIAVVYI